MQNKILNFLKKNKNKIKLKKITEIISSMIITPYDAIGQPERLKHKLSGKWSRRINQKDRLIYSVDEAKKDITIYSLKGHYERNN